MSIGKQMSGFSLLELLLAAFLGVSLLGTVLQSYLGVKSIYRAQSDLANLSENMRFVDFILWQSIAQAGFAGWRRVAELDLNNSIKREEYDNPFFGIRGYDSANPPFYLNSSVVAGTDVIVIGKASSEATPVLNSVPKGARSILVERNLTTESKHFLLISDGENADLFSSKGQKKKIINLSPLSASLAHDYRKGNAEVRLFEEMIFFIKYPSDKKERSLPGLYLCFNRGHVEELISDVSDMQVSYGVDIGGSHNYLKAKEIVKPELWDKVSDVRIDLTMHGKLLTKQKRIYIKLRERG